MNVEESERDLIVKTPLDMLQAVRIRMLIPFEADSSLVISLIVDEQIVPFSPEDTFYDRLRYRLAMGKHWDARKADELFS